jgi:hypothetical protein
MSALFITILVLALLLVLLVILVVFRLVDALVGLLLAAAGMVLLWGAARWAAISLPWEAIGYAFLALFGVIVIIRLVAAIIITAETYGRRRHTSIGTPRARGRGRGHSSDSDKTTYTY